MKNLLLLFSLGTLIAHAADLPPDKSSDLPESAKRPVVVTGKSNLALPKHDLPADYTLTVAATLEELLSTLARRFGLELALDGAGLARAGVAPAEIVRLELKDVSREQLLDAICAPRQLAWHIEGDTLSVSAAR